MRSPQSTSNIGISDVPSPEDPAGSPPAPISPAPIVTLSVTAGFAVALAMWLVALLTHIPGMTAPAAVSGPLMLGVLAVGCLLAVRWSIKVTGDTSHRATLGVGAGTGLVAALVCMLILGALLAESPEGLDPDAVTGAARPGASLAAAGFLVTGLIAGLIAGVIAKAAFMPTENPRARTEGVSARLYAVRRFGLLASLAFLPLLALGGATTSAEAGFAVPDWPGSYGANMFVFPISQMAQPRIFLEHSHRLFGSLVGLNVLVWAVLLWVTPRVRTAHRVIASVLLITVIVQGVIGGVWVLKQSTALVVSHGVLAQVVFASVAGLSAWVATSSTGAAHQPPGRAATRVRTIGAVAVGILLVMLTFGAVYRHTHASHALWAHIGFSLVVIAMVSTAGFLAIRAGAIIGRPVLSRIGSILITLLGIQFALGWLVLFLVGTGSASDGMGPAIPQASELATAVDVGLAELLFATAHQLIGASLLGLATIVAVLGPRLRPLAPAVDATADALTDAARGGSA